MAAGGPSGGRARAGVTAGRGRGRAGSRGRAGRGVVSPRPGPRAKGRGAAPPHSVMPLTETSTAGVYVTDAGAYVTRTS